MKIDFNDLYHRFKVKAKLEDRSDRYVLENYVDELFKYMRFQTNNMMFVYNIAKEAELTDKEVEIISK